MRSGVRVLAEVDLRFADLTGARLHDADLSGADLSGAVGYTIDPERTRLTGTLVALPEAAAILELMGLSVTSAGQRLTPAERLADI
ncbi:MAG TPA: pentapeptide repeat-containing protein [Euzebya sp.]|nr:pentapeptide repeat-containing protein [Euzebya sp.]